MGSKYIGVKLLENKGNSTCFHCSIFYAHLINANLEIFIAALKDKLIPF